MFRPLFLSFLAIALGLFAHAEPLTIRVVAANLTSGKNQSYSPDNGNHSNPEGAGARILKAVKPDIVLIQEFNTTIPVRQWVNRTFGEEYAFMKEEGEKQIPNGIISRFPIVESGAWDDPVLDNREFAWARIKLPGDKDLWAVSVHLHSKGSASRDKQSAALVKLLSAKVPGDAMILLGGDFNTASTGEPAFKTLSKAVVIPQNPPVDQHGLIDTNSPRNKPYDWVTASEPLDKLSTPVKIAGHEFPHGLVLDTRVFEPLDKLPPAQKDDSAAPFMQHMAVIRDFLIP